MIVARQSTDWLAANAQFSPNVSSNGSNYWNSVHLLVRWPCAGIEEGLYLVRFEHSVLDLRLSGEVCDGEDLNAGGFDGEEGGKVRSVRLDHNECAQPPRTRDHSTFKKQEDYNKCAQPGARGNPNCIKWLDHNECTQPPRTHDHSTCQIY